MNPEASKPLAIKSNYIFVDSVSDPTAGYLIINKEKVEKVVAASSISSRSLAKLHTTHRIIDYSEFYVIPGLIDMNVMLNCTYDEEWSDVVNTTKQAVAGGITTIVDSLHLTDIQKHHATHLNTDHDADISILDERDHGLPKREINIKQIQQAILHEQQITERMENLKQKLYCDCALFGVIDSKILNRLKETFEACNSLVVGWRVSLSPGQNPCNNYLYRRDIEAFLTALVTLKKKKQVLISINSTMANYRDIFLPSPCRSKAIESRKNLSENVGDYGNFGGGINGPAKSDKEGSNETKKDYENNLEYEGVELKTPVLKAHSYRMAQFNEENNIARMEMMDYNSVNPDDLIKKEGPAGKMNESINDYNTLLASNYFSFHFEDSDNETDFKVDDNCIHSAEQSFEKYQKSIIVTPSKNKFNLDIKPRSLNTNLLEDLSLSKAQSEDKLITKFHSESVVEQFNEYEARDTVSEDLSKRKRKAAGLALIQSNMESSKDSLSIKSPNLTPSKLMQRRELTLSLQSPGGVLSNRSMFNLQTDRKSTKNGDLERRKMRNYQCYLSVYPLALETNGVEAFLKVIKTMELDKSLSKQTNAGVKLLFTNLSSPHLLYLLREAKRTSRLFQILTDTSAPFLHFFNEKIPDGSCIFKSAPPIREKGDRELLIRSLLVGVVDSVSSNHMQVPYGYKFIDEGNFRRAYPGLSSIGCTLQTVWTRFMIFEKKAKQTAESKSNKSQNPSAKPWNKIGTEKDFLNDETVLAKYVRILISACCETPAKILNIHNTKGTLKKGMNADFVVWDPHSLTTIRNSDVFLAYRDVFIMKGQKLYGTTKATFLRGNMVYSKEKKGEHKFYRRGSIVFPREK
jgi:dihydroorotase-like cyclic amidohydrolase